MAGDTVGLTDIVARLPALVMDAPVVLRGTLTAFLARGRRSGRSAGSSKNVRRTTATRYSSASMTKR